ncbi:hypothetical protein, partial [Pseudotabrizicola algicola]|uniref:hypothetical protein n=1 Tax=Pseudotabrizicola algicola TaxID=2709381 RepID=UPI001966CF8E
QTVKLSPGSSGKNPTWPICKQSDADAPKPPTYPFIHQIFKDHEDKNFRTTNLLVLPATLPSDVNSSFRHRTNRFVPRSRITSASVRRCLGPRK